MTLLVCLFFFLGTAAALFLIAEGGRSYVRRSEIEGDLEEECVGCGAPAVTVYRGMAVCQSFAQELEEDAGA